MNRDAKSSGAAIAGMYKFVKPAGRDGIIVRLETSAPKAEEAK